MCVAPSTASGITATRWCMPATTRRGPLRSPTLGTTSTPSCASCPRGGADRPTGAVAEDQDQNGPGTWSGHPQDLRPPDLTSLQLDQGPVRLRQIVFPDLGLERDLGRQAEELAHVGPGDVGDALDLLLQPEVSGVVDPQQGVLVDLLLADRIDDQTPAPLQVFERLDDRRPGRGRVDDRVQPPRGPRARLAGPGRPEFAGERPLRGGASEREYLRPGEAVQDQLQNQVRRGPEAGEAQGLPVLQPGQAEGAEPDRPRAQEGCGLYVGE